MARILLVSERFWPEDFIINDLAAELFSRGHRVTVLTQQPSYPHGRTPRGRANNWLTKEIWQGVEIWRFKTVLGYRESLLFKLFAYLWFATWGTLVTLLLPRTFDAVFSYQTGPLTQTIPAIVSAKLQRKPLTIWTQDVWPDSVYAYGFKRTNLLTILLDQFVRWVYRSASSICISCRGFATILNQYTDKPLHFAPNWPLIPFGEVASSAHPEKTQIFLFAGNVGKVQNLENVILGFQIAIESHPQVAKLRIVGDGSNLKELKGLAFKLKVPVEFAGRKLPSEMNLEYSRADFLVLSLADQPVFHLTVPSKFQMYLSVGKPILCAAGGEVAEIVRSSGLGLTPAAANPAQIASAILVMATSSYQIRRAWSSSAKSLLDKTYDRTRIIDYLETMITRQW